MSLGDVLFGRLAPVATEDAAESNALADYSAACVEPMEWVQTYAADTDENPGYGLWMDHDTCPLEGLGWLGQFVGVYLPPSTDEATARTLVGTHPYFRRGTKAAMVAAAQATLTGSKTVIVNERTPDAYALSVTTYASETPSSQNTQKAILSQKPAGLVLSYGASSTSWPYTKYAAGGTYAWLNSTYASYQAMMA